VNIDYVEGEIISGSIRCDQLCNNKFLSAKGKNCTQQFSRKTWSEETNWATSI